MQQIVVGQEGQIHLVDNTGMPYWPDVKCATAVAPAEQCPEGWEQVGDFGADIGGCGLDGCFSRGGYASMQECADHCGQIETCMSFGWAPMNGDQNFPGQTTCTIYDSDEVTGTWAATDGSFTSTVCKPEPVCTVSEGMNQHDYVKAIVDLFEKHDAGDKKYLTADEFRAFAISCAAAFCRPASVILDNETDQMFKMARYLNPDGDEQVTWEEIYSNLFDQLPYPTRADTFEDGQVEAVAETE